MHYSIGETPPGLYLMLPCNFIFCSLLAALPYVNPLVTPFGNDTGPHSIPINNTNTTMKCLFAGIPLPSQKWYFNGVHVGPKRASSDASSDEGEVTSELGLKQVSGVYQCYISNPYGTVFSSTTLCVQSESKGKLWFVLYKAATLCMG